MNSDYSENNEKKYPYVLSVCIPTYEMSGCGVTFLEHSLNILLKQTLKEFEVVISDNSDGYTIKNLCNKYDKLNIKYVRNPIKGMSANTNNAMKEASGSLIKILYQDDFLYSKTSLEDIVKNFDFKKDKWLVAACIHTIDGINFFKPFYPHYHDKIHLGPNTLSSPSALTIINENIILFDTNITWFMDCDYYERVHEKFGEPKILNQINTVNRVGAHQTSNTIVNELLKEKEYKYILKKYKIKNYMKLVAIYKAKKYLMDLRKFRIRILKKIGIL